MWACVGVTARLNTNALFMWRGFTPLRWNLNPVDRLLLNKNPGFVLHYSLQGGFPFACLPDGFKAPGPLRAHLCALQWWSLGRAWHRWFTQTWEARLFHKLQKQRVWRLMFEERSQRGGCVTEDAVQSSALRWLTSGPAVGWLTVTPPPCSPRRASSLSLAKINHQPHLNLGGFY